MLRVVRFFDVFVFCENFAAMFFKEITEIISTTDSCIGFRPECNERATEEKDSGRGDKRVWRAELL